jgi:ABC-type transporter Mla MlaB component
MLKITTLEETAETISLALIGDLGAAELPALEAAMQIPRASQKRILLNLEDVALVDRAAMKQLCLWKQGGLEVVHCPNYVSSWIRQDSGEV